MGALGEGSRGQEDWALRWGHWMVLPGDVEAFTSAGWWVCGEGWAIDEEAGKRKLLGHPRMWSGRLAFFYFLII